MDRGACPGSLLPSTALPPLPDPGPHDGTDGHSPDTFVQAEKLLAIFEGRTPLYYYFADKKEYRNMPFERFVDVNEPLLDELKKVLGEENVVMR